MAMAKVGLSSELSTADCLRLIKNGRPVKTTKKKKKRRRKKKKKKKQKKTQKKKE